MNYLFFEKMRQLTITEKLTDRNSQSVELYLKDISRYELISAEEEAILARQIKAGDEEALQKLVRANLRFVVSVAKQYQFQGLSLSDLINEGNIGLVKAAGRFDETRGFKFISYAVWWIRQSIIQAISESSRMIRMPLNKVDSVRKVKNAISELEQKYEREPSEEEVASLLGVRVNQVNETFGLSSKPLSIDTPFITGEENSLLDVLTDPNAEEADKKVVMTESLQTDINEALSTLNWQQQQVLRLFFGLGGKDPVGLEDIALRLNISPERVRQIKAKALAGLQASSNTLKTYLGN